MSIKVSVVMPVYNVEQYVEEAIESILTQSFLDFELIIIDDASTDRTLDVIKNFVDNRIRLFTNKDNIGLAASLNKGIRLAKGEYILRMDGDDISLPDRIKIQVGFMDSNPEIGISGTSIKLFGNASTINMYPLKDLSCKIHLLFGVPFAHPSVIIRKYDFISNYLYYDEKLTQFGEDYDLWVRAAKVVKFSNIPNVLLKYRTYAQHHKEEAEYKRFSQGIRTRKKMLFDLGISLSDQEFFIYNSIAKKQVLINSISNSLNYSEFVLNIIFNNLKTDNSHSNDLIKNCLSYHWFYFCYVQSSLIAVHKYFSSSFKLSFRNNKVLMVKFCIKPFYSLLKIK